MAALSNRPTLDGIATTPIGEIAALPAEHLALLQEEAADAVASAKRRQDWIEGAIALRYGERAEAERRAHGKDAGVVRLVDGAVTVVADSPKRVEWDQAALAALVERIRASGEDPADYVECAFKVSERRYAAWPSTIRGTFEPARTVRTGKPSFRLTLTSEDSR